MIIIDLINLANRLDEIGLTKEADILDKVILKAASVNIAKENIIRKCFVQSVSPEQIEFVLKKVMDSYNIKYSSIYVNVGPEMNGSVIATVSFNLDNYQSVKRENLLSYVTKTKISEKISLAVDFFASNFTTYLKNCEKENSTIDSNYCIKLKNSVSSGVIVTNIINNSPCTFSIEVSNKNENMA